MKTHMIPTATLFVLLLLVPTSLAAPSPVWAEPQVEPLVNHGSPADSGVAITLRAGADARGLVILDSDTRVTAGSWAQCGFTGCDLVRGVAAFTRADADAAGASVDALVVGNVIHFGGGPTNVWSGFGAGCSVVLPDGSAYFCLT